MDTAKRLTKNLPFLANHQSTSAPVFARLPGRGWSMHRYSLNRKVYDVVFIIDDSGSIPHDQFNKGLEALKILIQSSAWGTNIAAIKYSNTAKLLFKFVSKDQAKSNLANVHQNNGATNTQAALKMARENLFLNPAFSGHRPRAGRVAVLVTDGKSNIQRGQTVHQANLLRGIATEVFVIAVGNPGTSGLQEMKNIVSYPYEDHFYRVNDFSAFQQVARQVQANVQLG